MLTVPLLFAVMALLLIACRIISFYPCATGIPKMWGFPILGLLLHLKSDQYQETLVNALKNKGKLCTVQMGSYNCLWLNDYKVIREAWSNPAFCGRPKLQGIVDRTAGFSGGIIFNDGKDFREQRSFTVSQLKDLGLGRQSMEIIISQEVDDVVGTLIRNNGAPISTRHLFNMASLNVLWAIIGGERYQHDDKELNDLVESITRNMELQGGAMLGFFIPWLAKWFPKFVGWNAYLADANKVFEFWRKFAETRIQSYDCRMKGNEPSCFVDMYINEIKNCKTQSSSFYGQKGELSLAATLQDLFIAGTETTATTLSWIMLYLAAFQEYQQKVHQEIQLIIGEMKPTLFCRRKTPITEAFILETMRHITLAPLGMIHCARKDAELCGNKIQKGTLIYANLAAAHYDPCRWENPNSFCPERFLSPHGTHTIQNDSFLPFSYGKRRCPGEAFAKNELYLFLVGIVQHFLVTIDPIHIEDCLKPKLGVSATPKFHLLNLTKR